MIRCFRTLDEPVRFFGLEADEMAALVVLFGILVFVEPLAAIGAVAALAMTLRRARAGGPKHLWYRVAKLTGASVSFRGLVLERRLDPIALEDRKWMKL